MDPFVNKKMRTCEMSQLTLYDKTFVIDKSPSYHASEFMIIMRRGANNRVDVEITEEILSRVTENRRRQCRMLTPSKGSREKSWTVGRNA